MKTKAKYLSLVMALSFGLVACSDDSGDGSNNVVNNPSNPVNKNKEVSEDFDYREGANARVNGIVEVDEGKKIYVFGDFDEYNGVDHNRLVRLHEDGTFDNSFNCGECFNGEVHAVLPSPSSEGQVYVAGAFTEVNGTLKNRIVRLNVNGTIDEGFDIKDDDDTTTDGDGFDNTVFDLAAAKDSSGDIYPAGKFYHYKDMDHVGIIRLKVDGDVDIDFDSRNKLAAPGVEVNAVITAEDDDSGDITIGGFFYTYDGEQVNGLVRLNAEGTIDESFNIGYGDTIANENKGIQGGVIRTLSLTGDGSEHIMAGGDFDTYRGQPANQLVRIDHRGDIETDFNFREGFDGSVEALLPIGDRLYVGGSFSDYDGSIPARSIIALDWAGNHVEDFEVDAGFDLPVYGLTQIKGSDYLYVGGEFTEYQEEEYGSILRLDDNGDVK